MHVRLPDGAQLFNIFVNNESVPVVRDEQRDSQGAYLFNVAPEAGQEHTAAIRMVTQSRNCRTAASSLPAPSSMCRWKMSRGASSSPPAIRSPHGGATCA